MATSTQIFEIRIRINDPAGYQEITEVANEAALPATPAPYTAYKLADTGAYMASDDEAGASDPDYDRLEINISDSRISDFIDTYGLDEAECRALAVIATRLGAQMRLKRVQGGSENTEFTALKELYNYYKALSQDCKEKQRKNDNNNTGRYGTSDQPEIAGGEV